MTVDGDRVLRVRGDAGHPVSRGYACAKGRGLPAWHHHERAPRPAAAAGAGRRVGRGARRPRRGAARHRRRVRRRRDRARTWPPAWPTTPPARSRRGPSSASLGSSSFYTAVTVDNAPVLVAAELVTGNAMMNPLWDPTAPGLLLLVGYQPGRVPRVRDDAARPGQLPARLPARRRAHLGRRPAAHRERGARRPPRRGASGQRRAAARRDRRRAARSRRRLRRAHPVLHARPTSPRCGRRSRPAPSRARPTPPAWHPRW